MTEVLEDLDRLVLYLMQLDDSGESLKYQYDDEDMVNAAHVFYHVLSNRYVHSLAKGISEGDEAAMENAREKAGVMGKEIAEIVLKFSGVDTRTYYQEQLKKHGIEFLDGKFQRVDEDKLEKEGE